MRITLPILGTVSGLIAFCNPATAASLFFDFGDGAAVNLSAAPVNNVTQAQAPVVNATDSTGSATGISLTTVGFNTGSNLSGTNAPTGAAAIFSATSTVDNLFGHTQTFGGAPPLPNATLTFTGLDGSGKTSYRFDFFASRTGVADIRSTLYTATGLGAPISITLDASNNTANVAVIPSLLPNAAGSIVVDVRPAAGNNNTTGFFYLGALRLTTTPVPEPSAAAMAALGLLACVRRRRELR